MKTVNMEFPQVLEILASRKLAINFGEVLRRGEIDNINFVKNQKQGREAIRNRQRSCEPKTKKEH